MTDREKEISSELLASAFATSDDAQQTYDRMLNPDSLFARVFEDNEALQESYAGVGGGPLSVPIDEHTLAVVSGFVADRTLPITQSTSLGRLNYRQMLQKFCLRGTVNTKADAITLLNDQLYVTHLYDEDRQSDAHTAILEEGLQLVETISGFSLNKLPDALLDIVVPKSVSNDFFTTPASRKVLLLHGVWDIYTTYQEHRQGNASASFRYKETAEVMQLAERVFYDDYYTPQSQPKKYSLRDYETLFPILTGVRLNPTDEQ